MKTKQYIQRPEICDLGQAQKIAAGLRYFGVITSAPLKLVTVEIITRLDIPLIISKMSEFLVKT